MKKKSRRTAKSGILGTFQNIGNAAGTIIKDGAQTGAAIIGNAAKKPEVQAVGAITMLSAGFAAGRSKGIRNKQDQLIASGKKQWDRIFKRD